jgi:hypothetical protein
MVQSHKHHMDRQVMATHQCLSTFVIARSDQYLTGLTLTQLLNKDSEYKKAWLKQRRLDFMIL